MWGVSQDITSRTRAEEDLRLSEARYRSIFDIAANLITSINREGIIIDCNRQVEKVLGYTREELIGQPMAMIIPEEYLSKARETLERVLTEGFSYGDACKMRRHDGHLIDVVSNSSALKGPSGEYESTICILDDITERKRLEAEMAKTEKLESLGVLAGGIAHDFNNSLTAILGNISLAKMDAPEGALRDSLSDAEKAATQSKRLTQQLLTFARGGVPVREISNINETIKESGTLALTGSNVKCKFELAGDLEPVDVDKSQLGQVIQNLTINALQSMPGGGVITISSQNCTVSGNDPVPLAPGPFAKIRIVDSGGGIPEDQMGLIFDPFFSTKKSGRGLGLSTAFSIVSGHGGHIGVESEVGVGTSFEIYLPISEHPLPPINASEVAPTSRQIKVLVMDDEEHIRTLLSKILPKLGYSTATVANGSLALEKYQAALDSGEPFDLVILDLTIPGGMGGRETMRHLLKMDPNVRAIVSTGYSNDPILANCKAYGFCNIMAKPYRVDDVSRVLQQVLSQPTTPAGV